MNLLIYFQIAYLLLYDHIPFIFDEKSVHVIDNETDFFQKTFLKRYSICYGITSRLQYVQTKRIRHSYMQPYIKMQKKFARNAISLNFTYLFNFKQATRTSYYFLLAKYTFCNDSLEWPERYIYFLNHGLNIFRNNMLAKYVLKELFWYLLNHHIQCTSKYQKN